MGKESGHELVLLVQIIQAQITELQKQIAELRQRLENFGLE
jgi:prefoldin subunit 5